MMIQPSREVLVELRRLLVEPARAREALEALERIGDYRAIPYFAWLLARPEYYDMAARVVTALMPRDSGSLATLDESIRGRSYEWPDWWRETRLPPVPVFEISLSLRRSKNVALPGLLSFSADGYAREKALHVLAANDDGRELPFFLLRANDWVEPVSRYALRASAVRLRSGYEAHFVEHLTLVHRLAGRHRWNHQAFVNLVEDFLSSGEAGQRALLAGSGTEDRATRRAIIAVIARKAGEMGGLSDEVFSRLLTDPDPVIRARAVDAFERRSSDDAVAALVHRLMRDGSAAMRRRAWALAERRAPEVADALAPEVLFDRNVWLREFARQRLLQSGRVVNATDFASIYRRALLDGSQVTGALLGLAELGTREDAALAAPYVAASSAHVRRAALLAVVHLDRERASALLVEALSSPHQELARLAAERLTKSGVTVDLDDVAAVMDDSRPQARARALRILSVRDRWTALIFALRLRRDPDEHVARVVKKILNAWRRVPTALFVGPPKRYREELATAVESLTDEPDIGSTLSVLLRR